MKNFLCHIFIIFGRIFRRFGSGFGSSFGYLCQGFPAGKMLLKLGYSRKYPHPSMDGTHWIGYLKISRISKDDSSRFCRILNLADSRYWGISEFCKTFNDFHGIPVKIHKFWEIHGFPVKLTQHFLQDFQCRPWGGVWVFSGIAH